MIIAQTAPTRATTRTFKMGLLTTNGRLKEALKTITNIKKAMDINQSAKLGRSKL